MTDYLGYGYAVVVAVGGIIGYVKKGSVASLAAGLIFGGASGYGASLTSKNPADFFIILGSSVVLAGVMGHRYYNSQKVMPAGLVAGLSLLMVARYGYRMIAK